MDVHEMMLGREMRVEHVDLKVGEKPCVQARAGMIYVPEFFPEGSFSQLILRMEKCADDIGLARPHRLTVFHRPDDPASRGFPVAVALMSDQAEKAQ
jgi:hypothetical protein